MVTRIKTDDEIFVANKKNETFLVDGDADLVFSNTTVGILGSDPTGGRTIRIDGSFVAPVAVSNAIQIECSAKKVERIIVGSTGEVSAGNAISASGGLIDIRVAGRIEGDVNAIGLSTDKATIRNSGTIEGGSTSAVLLISGDMTLRNSGQIISDETSPILAFGGNCTIVNEGTIAGPSTAINASGAPSTDFYTIVNTGEIIGDIDLSGSARNDLVDTSNGRVEGDILTGAGADRLLLVNAIVTGTVFGGLGDDVYTISSDDVAINEATNAGTDTVRATGNVSVTLAANFENIILIGKNDTQATGNGVDNVITGNAGNNIIDGAAGEDTIRGGKGRDELIGGADIDTFIFRKGDGKDLIGDFDTGGVHDFLDLSGIRGITDFDDLIENHALDVDGDVVINAGKGDQVVLEGLTVAELRAELFFL